MLVALGLTALVLLLLAVVLLGLMVVFFAAR